MAVRSMLLPALLALVLTSTAPGYGTAYSAVNGTAPAGQAPGRQEPQLTGDAFRGEFIFFQRCSLCNLNVSKGGPIPAAGPDLNGVLKDPSPERDAKVRDQIRNGSSRMPGFQYGLSATQLDQLMAYLKTRK